MSNIKICLNCGDQLLELAKKCPSCGKKDLLLIDRNENEKILEIKNNVPHPKSGFTPKWKANLAATERKLNAEANGIACCPKCGSTSISANKKGFGIGKAIIGAKITKDPLGLVAGNLGANKILVTCLYCGHQWKAGK